MGRKIVSNKINIISNNNNLVNNKAIIVSRVSTTKQTNGISLDSQEEYGKKFIRDNQMILTSTYKRIGSAYNNEKTLKDIFNNNSNVAILFYDASRFSRNIEHAEKMLDLVDEKNITLVFLHENLTYRNGFDRKKILNHVQKYQDESSQIGRRISDAKKSAKEKGYYTGGRLPYGYDAVQKENGKYVLMKNKYEQDVIAFINLCTKWKISHDEINNAMKKISNDTTPINLYDSDGDVVDKITEGLTREEIVNLLNDYGVMKDGKTWTVSKLSTVRNNYYKYNNITEFSPEEEYDEEEELLNSLNNMNIQESPFIYIPNPYYQSMDPNVSDEYKSMEMLSYPNPKYKNNGESSSSN